MEVMLHSVLWIVNKLILIIAYMKPTDERLKVKDVLTNSIWKERVRVMILPVKMVGRATSPHLKAKTENYLPAKGIG